MEYLELTINSSPEMFEFLVAELSAAGFESFDESGAELKAYIQISEFDEQQMTVVLGKYNIKEYSTSRLKEKNWNEVWESNFQPINVEDRCIVRASFHEPCPQFDYEILINPKMSFGTGHHQTTYLMIKWMLANNSGPRMVLDAGCGTGILSILAIKQGAQKVIALDIDEWAFENTKENIRLNNASEIEVIQGTIRKIPLVEKYDLILANIEKNVLLDEMGEYKRRLNSGGTVVMSGFLSSDLPDIMAHAESEGLIIDVTLQKDNWLCCSFVAE